MSISEKISGVVCIILLIIAIISVIEVNVKEYPKETEVYWGLPITAQSEAVQIYIQKERNEFRTDFEVK